MYCIKKGVINNFNQLNIREIYAVVLHKMNCFHKSTATKKTEK